MRLPKKVLINNRPFRVVRDKNETGDNFKYRNMTITVGACKKRSSREQLNGFMHEVAEISCCERGMRCTTDRNTFQGMNDYRFIGNHEQFTDVITDVASIIGDMMELE